MNTEQQLNDKMTQITALYSIKLTIHGEHNESSVSRLIEYIKMQGGNDAINSLATKNHAELRRALQSFDLAELRRKA